MDIKLVLLALWLYSDTSLAQDGGITEVNPHDCKIMFTYGYGYNKYFHISESGGHSGDNITIRFLVRARSDAHLLLSSAPSPVEGQAVYEVVLGAGRNTFSDIRRLRRSSTKATARTVDILSPVELRGFWVHVSYKGDIQVGKEGDDVPFLFWTDPTPLPVLYFSFCTWTGVVGKWLYDCPIANDTEKIELVEPKPATMTEKLRKDLLSNYNPYALPVLHEDHRVAVFMHLTFHHVRLDVKRSVFSVDGIMPMHWMDEKMHWKPEDYGGLKSVHVNEHEVWVPEIVLYNAVGHGANILGHAGMTITSDGTVMWSPSVHLEAWCNLNLDRWPKDEHTCELQLGFWSQQQFLELIPGNDTVMEDEQRTGSEWEVIKMESETIITQNPWSQDVDIIDLTSSTSGTLTIRITVRRQNHPHTTMLVTPLLVVSALIFLSFWMSPLGADRLSVLCACLVLLSLFTITIGNILPAPAEHVPCLVQMYSWSMVAGVLAVLLSTLVICITRYSQAVPPPAILCAFISLRFTRLLLLLPQVNTEAGKTYNHLQENCGENDTCSIITTGNMTSSTTKHQEIQQYWIILGKAIDRISCFIYFIFLIVLLFKYN